MHLSLGFLKTPGGKLGGELFFQNQVLYQGTALYETENIVIMYKNKKRNTTINRQAN